MEIIDSRTRTYLKGINQYLARRVCDIISKKVKWEKNQKLVITEESLRAVFGNKLFPDLNIPSIVKNDLGGDDRFKCPIPGCDYTSDSAYRGDYFTMCDSHQHTIHPWVDEIKSIRNKLAKEYPFLNIKAQMYSNQYDNSGDWNKLDITPDNTYDYPCTYWITGGDYKTQFWYNCRECFNGDPNSGVCCVCVKDCKEKGHELVLRLRPFFCDKGSQEMVDKFIEENIDKLEYTIKTKKVEKVTKTVVVEEEVVSWE